MSAGRFLRSRALLILLLAGMAFLTYAPSLRNDFVIWDDDSLVYQNPLTQEMTPATVWGAFTSYDPELYVPLTIVAFQIEHALFGFTPFFFHLDNLLLHIVAASLLLILLESLGLERRTAFLGALLFAVHPLNTEAVAWVSARKDLLAAVFSLLSLLSYLQLRDDSRHRWRVPTFLFFLLALLSKPVAIVLPAAFLLMDWLTAGNLKKTRWPVVLIATALSALFLVIGLYGKQQNLTALTAGETLLLAAKSTIFSVQTFFWPANLSVIYLQTDPITVTLPQFWVPLLLLTGIALLLLWSLRRTRLLAFAALWYLLFLLPSFANFAKDDVYVFSDRYIYLAQIGVLVTFGYGLERLFRGRHRAVNAIVGILLIGIVGSLAWTARAQSLLWHDSETLYRDALAKNDRSVVMHYNLAVLEHRRGNRAAARVEYERALAIDPHDAKALSNLGVLYKEEGQTGIALETLRRAIEADPRFADPHNAIGSILMDRGDIDGAIAEFRRAIALRETFAQAHINLAAALGRTGLYEEALREYKRAFELAPQLLEGLPEIRRALENF